LRGRVNGTMLFLMWGAMPIGALLGGALGEVIGVPATMAVAAGGIQLAVGWIALSPVRLVRARPTRGADQGVAADDHVPAASG